MKDSSPHLSLPWGNSEACASAGDTGTHSPGCRSLLGHCQPLHLSTLASVTCTPHPLPGFLSSSSSPPLPVPGLGGALGPGGRRCGVPGTEVALGGFGLS